MVRSLKTCGSLTKPLLPAAAFLTGVAYDTLTLTRIDRLQDNLILLLYLALLGFLIILTGRLEAASASSEQPLLGASRLVGGLLSARSYYPMAKQFLFGGLFSAYAIFYSKSASLTTTAVFFAVLIGLLVANEFLHDRLSSLRLLVALYAVVTFSFFTFFLPVMTGWMNTIVFLIGAVLSTLVILRLVELVYRGRDGVGRSERVKVAAPALAVIGVLVGFYFLNWIPPVPLSMKFGGIYHEVKKAGDRFELSFEKKWYQVWKRSDTTFPANEPIYCFTAVFAPVDLNTTIYHHWFYRTNGKKPFAHADRIPIKISGGREGGYRAYTFKQRLDPGDWRVDVETEDGRVLGRVSVVVVDRGDAQPALTTISY
jgi:hypothetical protein